MRLISVQSLKWLLVFRLFHGSCNEAHSKFTATQDGDHQQSTKVKEQTFKLPIQGWQHSNKFSPYLWHMTMHGDLGNNHTWHKPPNHSPVSIFVPELHFPFGCAGFPAIHFVFGEPKSTDLLPCLLQKPRVPAKGKTKHVHFNHVRRTFKLGNMGLWHQKTGQKITRIWTIVCTKLTQTSRVLGSTNFVRPNNFGFSNFELLSTDFRHKKEGSSRKEFASSTFLHNRWFSQ